MTNFGNGVCVDCGQPALGRMKRCLACNTEVIRRRVIRATVAWKRRNRDRVLRLRRARDEANRDHVRAYHRAWCSTHREQRRQSARRWKAKQQMAAPAIAYRIVERVGELVPRMPGRDDVIQDVLLALMEGRVALAHLEARGVGEFVRGFRRAAYERGGHALSLDAPMFGGGSWHDRITTEAML